MSTFSSGWLGYVTSMLWQSSVLMLLVWLAYTLCWRRSPALRYALLCLVLLKFLLPTGLHSVTGIGHWFGRMRQEQMLPVEIPFSAGDLWLAEPSGAGVPDLPAWATDPDVFGDTGAVAATALPVSRPHRLFRLWAWTCGLLFMALFLYAVRMHRRFRAAEEVLSPPVNELLADCRVRLGIRRRVRLFALPGLASPVLAGLFRPRILVSTDNLAELDAAALRPIFLHELAHVKRHDLWVNFLQVVLQTLWFFHPGLWFTNRLLRREREKACDDVVLAQLGGQGRVYAESILAVLRQATRSPFATVGLVGIAESNSALHGRLKRILRAKGRIVAGVGVLGGMALLVLAVVLLPMAEGERKTAVNNPIAEVLLGSDRCQSDMANTFFLVTRKGWAIMLPEGLCAQVDTLEFDGGFDKLMERKAEFVEARWGWKDGDVAAIILIQDEGGILVKDKLEPLLRRRNVKCGVEFIDETTRTDREHLLAQAESMDGEDEIVDLPIDMTLTNLPDLYLLDKFNMPRPLRFGGTPPTSAQADALFRKAQDQAKRKEHKESLVSYDRVLKEYADFGKKDGRIVDVLLARAEARRKIGGSEKYGTEHIRLIAEIWEAPDLRKHNRIINAGRRLVAYHMKAGHEDELISVGKELIGMMDRIQPDLPDSNVSLSHADLIYGEVVIRMGRIFRTRGETESEQMYYQQYLNAFPRGRHVATCRQGKPSGPTAKRIHKFETSDNRVLHIDTDGIRNTVLDHLKKIAELEEDKQLEALTNIQIVHGSYRVLPEAIPTGFIKIVRTGTDGTPVDQLEKPESEFSTVLRALDPTKDLIVFIIRYEGGWEPYLSAKRIARIRGFRTTFDILPENGSPITFSFGDALTSATKQLFAKHVAFSLTRYLELSPTRYTLTVMNVGFARSAEQLLDDTRQANVDRLLKRRDTTITRFPSLHLLPAEPKEIEIGQLHTYVIERDGDGNPTRYDAARDGVSVRATLSVMENERPQLAIAVDDSRIVSWRTSPAGDRFPILSTRKIETTICPDWGDWQKAGMLSATEETKGVVFLLRVDKPGNAPTRR